MGLRDFGDFARTNACRANLDRLRRALHKGMNSPQVGIPTALGYIMRVTDMIAIFRTFSAKVAGTCHFHTPLESTAGLPQTLIVPNNGDFAHHESAVGLQ
jgi:hypothetical protein